MTIVCHRIGMALTAGTGTGYSPFYGSYILESDQSSIIMTTGTGRYNDVAHGSGE
jgi:hypothetical protein